MGGPFINTYICIYNIYIYKYIYIHLVCVCIYLYVQRRAEGPSPHSQQGSARMGGGGLNTSPYVFRSGSYGTISFFRFFEDRRPPQSSGTKSGFKPNFVAIFFSSALR